MNFILTADSNKIEEVVDKFKGRVQIMAVSSEPEYLNYIQELALRYSTTDDAGKINPVTKVSILTSLTPRPMLAYAKGSGYYNYVDDNGVGYQGDFSLEDYITMYLDDLITNSFTNSKLYLMAYKVYSSQMPVVVTCTDDENNDLLILDVFGKFFAEYFKILPCTIKELESNRDILRLQPDPKYFEEVEEFYRGFTEMKKNKNVNLR